jgi:hypothetical protein
MLFVSLAGSTSALVARVRGRWPLKIQKKCPESQKNQAKLVNQLEGDEIKSQSIRAKNQR